MFCIFYCIFVAFFIFSAECTTKIAYVRQDATVPSNKRRVGIGAGSERD